MKKTSFTFFKISAILSFVCLGIYIACGVIFIVLSSLKDFIIEGIEDGTIHTDIEFETTEQLVTFVSIMFVLTGVMFLILAVLSLISAIAANKAKNNIGVKKVMITAIVFGAISGNYLSIPGGVLGLIYGSKHPEDNN